MPSLAERKPTRRGDHAEMQTEEAWRLRELGDKKGSGEGQQALTSPGVSPYRTRGFFEFSRRRPRRCFDQRMSLKVTTAVRMLLSRRKRSSTVSSCCPRLAAGRDGRSCPGVLAGSKGAGRSPVPGSCNRATAIDGPIVTGLLRVCWGVSLIVVVGPIAQAQSATAPGKESEGFVPPLVWDEPLSPAAAADSATAATEHSQDKGLGAAPASERKQVVLLTNDRVLEGKVSRNGRFYTIELADLARVAIPESQVVFVGESMQAVYAYKRSLIRETHPGDHYQLARWCLSQDLCDEAIVHYQRVAQKAGTHPRVRQLGEQIKLKLLNKPDFRAYLGLAPLAQPEAPSLASVSSQRDDGSETILASASGGGDGHPRAGEGVMPAGGVRMAHGVGSHSPAAGLPRSKLSAVPAGTAMRLQPPPTHLESAAPVRHGASPDSSAALVSPRELDMLEAEVRRLERQAGGSPVAPSPALASDEAALASDKAEDPFDPEAFNRRHRVGNEDR
ncbi:MAG: hypothetical protein KatS3mg111_4134 [Pirellulaceae bacterium]|nr:MAG: hypothetical protein KatS3mg111_4134 [Pirellulaceae bacterium]